MCICIHNNMPKTRMQILIDPEMKKVLEQEARSREVSVGQVIREAVELYGKQKVESEQEFTEDDPLWGILGVVSSSSKDLSEEHDHYLYGTPKRKKRKR